MTFQVFQVYLTVALLGAAFAGCGRNSPRDRSSAERPSSPIAAPSSASSPSIAHPESSSWSASNESSASSGSSASTQPKKGFQDGDLIFQQSGSPQSELVRVLTGGKWTHMGVIFKRPGGAAVLEALSPVRWTPLDEWIVRSGGRFVVKRVRDADARLNTATLEKMRSLGSSWIGRPYDLKFRWDDEALYCSELVYKLFERVAEIRLGKIERVADMNLTDPLVQRVLKTHFAGTRINPSEPVVTPDSMFNDEQLLEVAP